jgi:hypothetical protein
MIRCNILYVFSFLLIVGVVIILLLEYIFKKWKCIDGNCEKVIGGDYSDYNKCNAKCNSSKQQNTVTLQQSDRVNNPYQEPHNNRNCDHETEVVNNYYPSYGIPYYSGNYRPRWRHKRSRSPLRIGRGGHRGRSRR